MNDRLIVSKAKFFGQLKIEGFELGVKYANDSFEYSQLRKLKRAVDSCDEFETIDDIRKATDTEDADALFQEEDDRFDEPEFITAFVRGAISVLDNDNS